MVTSISSGTQNISGTVSSVPQTWTVQAFSIGRTSAGNTTLVTVPANHKYTVINATTGVTATTTTNCNSQIGVNGVTILYCQSIAGTTNTAISSNDTAIQLDKGTGFVATAGQIINLVQGGTGSSYASVIVVDEVV